MSATPPPAKKAATKVTAKKTAQQHSTPKASALPPAEHTKPKASLLPDTAKQAADPKPTPATVTVAGAKPAEPTITPIADAKPAPAIAAEPAKAGTAPPQAAPAKAAAPAPRKLEVHEETENYLLKRLQAYFTLAESTGHVPNVLQAVTYGRVVIIVRDEEGAPQLRIYNELHYKDRDSVRSIAAQEGDRLLEVINQTLASLRLVVP